MYSAIHRNLLSQKVKTWGAQDRNFAGVCQCQCQQQRAKGAPTRSLLLTPKRGALLQFAGGGGGEYTGGKGKREPTSLHGTWEIRPMSPRDT
eukprot:scaffold320667_cov30-Tisochrysis_lutea.AAC.1